MATLVKLIVKVQKKHLETANPVESALRKFLHPGTECKVSNSKIELKRDIVVSNVLHNKQDTVLKDIIEFANKDKTPFRFTIEIDQRFLKDKKVSCIPDMYKAKK